MVRFRGGGAHASTRSWSGAIPTSSRTRRRGADAGELSRIWEEQKARERAEAAAQSAAADRSALADVPRALPALTRAAKLGRRAARVGFDWETPRRCATRCWKRCARSSEALAGRAGRRRDGEARRGARRPAVRGRQLEPAPEGRSGGGAARGERQVRAPLPAHGGPGGGAGAAAAGPRCRPVGCALAAGEARGLKWGVRRQARRRCRLIQRGFTRSGLSFADYEGRPDVACCIALALSAGADASPAPRRRRRRRRGPSSGSWRRSRYGSPWIRPYAWPSAASGHGWCGPRRRRREAVPSTSCGCWMVLGGFSPSGSMRRAAPFTDRPLPGAEVRRGACDASVGGGGRGCAARDAEGASWRRPGSPSMWRRTGRRASSPAGSIRSMSRSSISVCRSSRGWRSSAGCAPRARPFPS